MEKREFKLRHIFSDMCSAKPANFKVENVNDVDY